MFRLLLVVIPAILLIKFSSCNSTADKKPTSRVEMEFSVDTTLTDLLLYDSATALQYRLPAGWQNLTGSYLAGSAFENAQQLPVRMIRFAGDTTVQLFLSLLDIQNMPDSHYRQLRVNYDQLLNQSHIWDRVGADTYYKDSLLVHQYVMTNARQTNFRLVFFTDQRPYFQLDYQVPNSIESPKYTKILESIIGSFKTSRNLVP